MGKDSFYCRYIKGTIDTIIAAAGILLFWWVYVLIAIAIKIEVTIVFVVKYKNHLRNILSGL